MCIIAIKPAGIDLMSIDTIKTMFLNNPDGAGYMYSYGNKVHIKKGFLEVQDLLDSLNDLSNSLDLKSIPLVLHFRIGTSGASDGATCHPFPVTNNLGLLQSQELETDLAMCHNGVMYDFEERKSEFSDTQLFISKCVSYLYSVHPGFLQDKRTKELLEPIINGSRLAFLDGAGNITRFGEWIESEGYYYSNNSYTADKFTYQLINSDYNYDYSYDYNCDYYDNNYYDYLDKDILDRLESFKEVTGLESINYIRCYYDLIEESQGLEFYDFDYYIVKLDPAKNIAIRIE